MPGTERPDSGSASPRPAPTSGAPQSPGRTARAPGPDRQTIDRLDGLGTRMQRRSSKTENSKNGMHAWKKISAGRRARSYRGPVASSALPRASDQQVLILPNLSPELSALQER